MCHPASKSCRVWGLGKPSVSVCRVVGERDAHPLGNGLQTNIMHGTVGHRDSECDTTPHRDGRFFPNITHATHAMQ